MASRLQERHAQQLVELERARLSCLQGVRVLSASMGMVLVPHTEALAEAHYQTRDRVAPAGESAPARDPFVLGKVVYSESMTRSLRDRSSYDYSTEEARHTVYYLRDRFDTEAEPDTRLSSGMDVSITNLPYGPWISGNYHVLAPDDREFGRRLIALAEHRGIQIPQIVGPSEAAAF